MIRKMIVEEANENLTQEQSLPLKDDDKQRVEKQSFM